MIKPMSISIVLLHCLLVAAVCLACPTQRKPVCPSYWYACVVSENDGTEHNMARLCVPFKWTIKGCQKKLERAKIDFYCKVGIKDMRKETGVKLPSFLKSVKTKLTCEERYHDIVMPWR